MPTETALFIVFVLVAFGALAGTLVYVDMLTRTVRKQNHPLPGE
ncbi:hypothetical protein [Ancylobacter pratisalsi]|nr:hypothetical protein [Ancylobacter pratisalsi]